MTQAEEVAMNALRNELDRLRARNRASIKAMRAAEGALSDALVGHAADSVITEALAEVRAVLAPPPEPRKPGTFEIPHGTKPSTCRSCGALMFWIKTAAGKAMPCNADGTSHFSTCPQANEHRKPRGGAA